MNIDQRIKRIELQVGDRERTGLAESIRLARERRQRGEEIPVREITDNSKLAKKIREARERVQRGQNDQRG
ncbi:MAG: hypothetical protein C0392_05785 [Syntrophus sp. (in: bacteria)]|nr:hypothetical protein [Syntrophus sp. (in: bacteria)]